MNQQNWISLIKEYKVLVGIIITGLFLIEFEIFTFAAMNSGKQSWIEITNNSGKIVYEVRGSTLTNFDKTYFEKTFGPFKNYQAKLTTKHVPFPFRAWFSAAIGVPVGLVLLLAFVLKAAMVFIYGGKNDSENTDDMKDTENGRNRKNKNNKQKEHGKSGAGLEKLLLRISGFNIFIIGFLVICMVFLLWVIPNTLTFMAKTSVETILEFKWVFLGVIIAVFVLFAWFMYMKYILAKKSIEAETEIRKYELRLEYTKSGEQKPAIEHKEDAEIKELEYLQENSLQNDSEEEP